MMVGMLSYANMGWPVLPIQREAKRPQFPYTVYDATTDHDKLVSMMREHPDCNIGVAAGKPIGCFVLDVDPRNGGFDSLAMLELQHGPLPKTPRARTGGGGEHYLFRLPDMSLCGKISGYPGIDIISTGRYFLVAPSTTKDGGKYRWMDSPWMTPVADAPDWLLHLIVVVPEMKTSVDDGACQVNTLGTAEARARAWMRAAPGARADDGGGTQTFLVARKLVHGFQVSEGVALDLMLEWNRRCEPPWTEKELRHKIRQAIARTKKMPVFRKQK